ncbi:hypothetical protein L873DRAFT_1640910, partial [Choiromyces venosus 120613-1]
MRIQGCKIILITNNCPSHPLPDSPPEDYNSPTQLQLINITLLYLPSNITSRLQPLNQGIIAPLK